MEKKEMVTTIQELIQKLKDSNISTYVLLESWESEIKSDNCKIDKSRKFEFLSRIFGFIWGLYSLEFITDCEKKLLFDYIESSYLSI